MGRLMIEWVSIWRAVFVAGDSMPSIAHTVYRRDDPGHAIARKLANVGLAALLLACAVPSNAVAAPMDGSWRADAPSCNAEELRREAPTLACDSFTLTLWSAGHKLCGELKSTGSYTRKVDDSDISGSIKGNTASVRFQSSWGGSGTAVIRVAGKRLYWHIMGEPVGENYVWNDAVLLKQKPMKAQSQSRKCPLNCFESHEPFCDGLPD
jgi:hypothetical protein